MSGDRKQFDPIAILQAAEATFGGEVPLRRMALVLHLAETEGATMEEICAELKMARSTAWDEMQILMQQAQPLACHADLVSERRASTSSTALVYTLTPAGIAAIRCWLDAGIPDAAALT